LGKYIIKRLLLIIPVFFGITIITFTMAHSIPGDPFNSEKLSEAARQQINRAYGLNKPIYEQYFTYIVNFFRGDWGPSFERKGQATVTEILFGYQGSSEAGIPFWLQLSLVVLAALLIMALVNLLLSTRAKRDWWESYQRLIIPTIIVSALGYLIFVIFTLDASKAGGFLFSLRLGILAFAFTMVVGITLGMICALNQNSWIDYVFTTVSLIGFSIPSFVLGLLALIVVVLINLWTGSDLPVAPSSPGVIELFLPAAILGAREAAIIARLTRSSMLEVIRQDYMRTAQAKGLNNRAVALRHGMKNAFIPILTVLGDRLAGLLTGSVTIERVFNIPGIGNYFVSSILAHDYPMILGTVVLYAMLVVIINLVVDLLYGFFDPRISYVKGSAA
jgi:oligopeptide transport system permease protein